MATSRPITPQELPKLIAAAVEKALTAHPVTPQQLANLSKFPIRCGIFPVEPIFQAEEPKAVGSPIIGHRPLPFGFILREFDLLADLTKLQPILGTEKEL